MRRRNLPALAAERIPPWPGTESDRKLAGLFQQYPDPAAAKLVQAIADSQGLKPEQVFAGVGSDDVLAMCFLTFFNSIASF